MPASTPSTTEYSPTIPVWELFQKGKPMPEFPPTHEQQNILDAVKTTKQNIMIRARAGCGKTTMLELIDHAEKSAPISSCASTKPSPPRPRAGCDPQPQSAPSIPSDTKYGQPQLTVNSPSIKRKSSKYSAPSPTKHPVASDLIFGLCMILCLLQLQSLATLDTSRRTISKPLNPL